MARTAPLMARPSRINTKKKYKRRSRRKYQKEALKTEICCSSYRTDLQGTHVELLAEGGLYAHVYETQFGQKLEVLAGEPAP